MKEFKNDFECILPIDKPETDSSCEMAMLFSILKFNKKHRAWLLNNFLQIYCLKDLYKVEPKVKRGTLNFFYNFYGDWNIFELTANPCLDYEKISFSSFHNLKINIVDFLKNQLKDGKYLLCGYDKYFISASEHYMRKHAGHTMFINGYTQSGFVCHDNFMHGKYQEIIVTEDEIKNSLHSLMEDEAVAKEANLSGVCSIKLQKNFRNDNLKELFSLNLGNIYVGIQEYLMNSKYAERYKNSSYFVFGVNCYEELFNFLNDFNEFVDWRAFCYMMDHKKVMLYRLQCISNEICLELGKEINTYLLLIQKFKLIIFNIIKYNQTGQKYLLAQNRNVLCECRNLEIETLNSVCSKIKQ